MPSPFPGMDPYIERWFWSTFHLSLIQRVMATLIQKVRPRYAVLAEQRIYLEHEPEGDFRRPSVIIPDLHIAETRASYPVVGRTSTAAHDPYPITLPMPEEVMERYLVVKSMESGDVVTIIEVLSPSNKRAGSDGRAQYLTKRDEVLRSRTGLVEIDLLRGGLRLPSEGPMPKCDYCAIVSRASMRPKADAYCWSIRDTLPIIPIPLAPGDDDVLLDLQEVFDGVYDASGYDYTLKYGVELEPPLSEDDQEWVKQLVELRNS